MSKPADELDWREEEELARAVKASTDLERVADSLERLVIAADSIATVLAVLMAQRQPDEPAFEICCVCGWKWRIGKPQCHSPKCTRGEQPK